VLESGLKVIPCIGEKLEQREANETQAVVEQQLDAFICKPPLPRSVHALATIPLATIPLATIVCAPNNLSNHCLRA
jgi:triosephosphate isomerase